MIGALLRIPREAMLRQVVAGLAAADFGDVRPAHFTVFQHIPPEGIRLTARGRAVEETVRKVFDTWCMPMHLFMAVGVVRPVWCDGKG